MSHSRPPIQPSSVPRNHGSRRMSCRPVPSGGPVNNNKPIVDIRLRPLPGASPGEPQKAADTAQQGAQEPRLSEDVLSTSAQWRTCQRQTQKHTVQLMPANHLLLQRDTAVQTLAKPSATVFTTVKNKVQLNFITSATRKRTLSENICQRGF